MAERRRPKTGEQPEVQGSAELKLNRSRPRGPAVPCDQAKAISTRIAQVVGSMTRAISQLCDETGFNHESVRRWVRGISPPPAHFLQPFCDVTGTSLVWLLTGRGPRESAKLPAYWLSFMSEAEIWEALRTRLPKDAQGRPVLPDRSDDPQATPSAPARVEHKHRPSKHDSETSPHERGVEHAPIQG